MLHFQYSLIFRRKQIEKLKGVLKDMAAQGIELEHVLQNSKLSQDQKEAIVKVILDYFSYIQVTSSFLPESASLLDEKVLRRLPPMSLISQKVAPAVEVPRTGVLGLLVEQWKRETHVTASVRRGGAPGSRQVDFVLSKSQIKQIKAHKNDGLSPIS